MSLANDDCFADQWTSLPTTIPNGGRRNFAHVQWNNERYFVGGRREGNFNVLKRVTSYHCMMEKWTAHPPLPKKRTLCAAALLNQHEFVVVGGDKDKDKFTYPRPKSLTRLSDLKKRRWWHACVCVDKMVNAIGGWNSDDEKDKDGIEMLDLSVPQLTFMDKFFLQEPSGCAACRH